MAARLLQQALTTARLMAERREFLPLDRVMQMNEAYLSLRNQSLLYMIRQEIQMRLMLVSEFLKKEEEREILTVKERAEEDRKRREYDKKKDNESFARKLAKAKVWW